MPEPIKCPKCNATTGLRPKQIRGGIIGPLISYAMADRECGQCGVIAISDFEGDVQSRIKRSRVMWMAAIIIGFMVFVAVIVQLAFTFGFITPAGR